MTLPSRLLVLLSVLALLLASAPRRLTAEDGAPKDRIVQTTRARIVLSAGLAEDARVPVLVAVGLDEHRRAALLSALRPKLRSAGKPYAIVFAGPAKGHAAGRAGPAQVAQGIEDALQQTATFHRGALTSPWILYARGGAAVPALQHAVADPTRFQGVILTDARLDTRLLPEDVTTLRPLRIDVIETRRKGALPHDGTAHLVAALKAARVPGRLHEIVAAEREPREALAAVAHIMAGFPSTAEAPRTFADVAADGRFRVTTKAADGLEIRGDLYPAHGKREADKRGPIVLLFHQARSSRGEYGPIATRLAAQGYHCLAIDQRSGGTWAGIGNETAARAKRAGKPTGYLDAKPDLERAIDYARELGYSGKLALLGSSYSSSLVFFVGAGNKDVAAVISFSPGDYLPPRGSILEAARKLTQPILVVCPPREERQSRHVFEPLVAKAKELFVQSGGVHGASTLYRSTTAEAAWKRLLAFLAQHLR